MSRIQRYSRPKGIPAMKYVRFAVMALAGSLLFWPGPGQSQEVNRIAAVVNDEIISIRDLESRIKLAMVVSNLPDTIENRRRLLPQVMRKMIDERLQLQEARRIKLQVGSDDINRAIATIEKQNRMPPGGLLGQLGRAGVDPTAVREQIRADVAWLRVIGRLLQPTIRVGEEEITDRLDTLRQQVGRPEYLLAAIELTFDTPAQEQEARHLGERLLDQLKSGAPFQALARQFSQGTSASNGGLMGWVSEINLDEEWRGPVAALHKGEISPLVRTGSGYAILTLVNQRIAGLQGEPDALSLFRLVFPIPSGKPPSREQLAGKARDMTASLKDCDGMEDLAGELNSPKSDRVDNIRPQTLPPEIAQAIAGLPVGKPSAPIETADGLAVFMVCSGGGGAGLPSRSQIRHQIEEERSELLARRHIRDLRRAAFVDFRL